MSNAASVCRARACAEQERPCSRVIPPRAPAFRRRAKCGVSADLWSLKERRRSGERGMKTGRLKSTWAYSFDASFQEEKKKEIPRKGKINRVSAHSLKYRAACCRPPFPPPPPRLLRLAYLISV